ncbi:alpha/beta hydrolase fold domain-containing protein [Microbacterium karelineae]|uniref:alpha/beta hydrolase fold domain-containing protein n=1 Tax=Microbacterium karelineae TaxID=2654283 RepID=UPI0018D4A00F|nr:alpha/beta hydrolase fold domain-containing protein [Microbacterium karelineae]
MSSRFDGEPMLDSGLGTAEWLALEAQLRERWGVPTAEGTIADQRDRARRLADTLAGATAVAPASACRIHEIEIDADALGTYARVYEPLDRGAAVPSQLFLHGGGFIHGSPRELVNESMLSWRAVRTGVRIVSMAYALAPEHPFPAARDQTIRVLAELRVRASELRIDIDRLGLGGNSAGASIAASATLELARRGASDLHHLSLEVPAVSLRGLHDLLVDAPQAQRDEIDTLLEAYRPDTDGAAFAADAADLGGFPPTLVVAAEHDPLRQGAALLADRLRATGVDVAEHVVPGTLHGSPGITRSSTSAQRWQRLVDRALQDAYGTEETSG